MQLFPQKMLAVIDPATTAEVSAQLDADQQPSYVTQYKVEAFSGAAWSGGSPSCTMRAGEGISAPL
jgi:hypothetical protein